MKIKYRKGDLIQLFEKNQFECIAHQCNTLLASELCGGIAKAIFAKYPRASINNSLKIKEVVGRAEILGAISIGDKEDATGLIFNLYAQYNPGSPSKGIDSFQCRLSYLKEALAKVKYIMKLQDYKTLGIPLIASGLAKQTGFTSFDDKEYFKLYILPAIKEVFKFDDIEITIVYLK